MRIKEGGWIFMRMLLECGRGVLMDNGSGVFIDHHPPVRLFLSEPELCVAVAIIGKE